MWRLRRDFAPCSRAPSPQVTDMTNGASEHRSSIRSVVFSSASLLSPLSARINDDVRKCSSTHGPGSNPGRVFIVRVRVRGRAPPLLTRFSLSSISTVFHLTVAMFCVFFTRTGRPGRELDDGRARRGVGSSRARARALASPRLASPRLASPRLVSPRLVSSRLISSHLVSSRLISTWHVISYVPMIRLRI